MKSRRVIYIFSLIGLFYFSTPVSAYANIGIPMIVLTLPAMIVLLLPVVLIEAAVFARTLEIKYKNTVWPSFLSNLISTVTGIPLAWLFLFAIEIITLFIWRPDISTIAGKIAAVTLNAAWIAPYRDVDMSWIISLATVVGLIPAYFISVFIEFRIVKRMFKNQEISKIKDAVKKANLVSYCFLIVLIPYLQNKLLYNYHPPKNTSSAFTIEQDKSRFNNNTEIPGAEKALMWESRGEKPVEN